MTHWLWCEPPCRQTRMSSSKYFPSNSDSPPHVVLRILNTQQKGKGSAYGWYSKIQFENKTHIPFQVITENIVMLIWWSYILVLGAWNEEKKVRWFLICSCPHLLICWGKNRKIFKKKMERYPKKGKMEGYGKIFYLQRSVVMGCWAEHLTPERKTLIRTRFERENYHCKILIKK